MFNRVPTCLSSVINGAPLLLLCTGSPNKSNGIGNDVLLFLLSIVSSKINFVPFYRHISNSTQYRRILITVIHYTSCLENVSVDLMVVYNVVMLFQLGSNIIDERIMSFEAAKINGSILVHYLRGIFKEIHIIVIARWQDPSSSHKTRSKKCTPK